MERVDVALHNPVHDRDTDVGVAVEVGGVGQKEAIRLVVIVLLADRGEFVGDVYTELHIAFADIGDCVPGVEIASVERIPGLEHFNVGRKGREVNLCPVEGDRLWLIAERSFHLVAVEDLVAGLQVGSE